MKFPLKVNSLTSLQLPEQEVHLAIGMFDGVHLGHRRVIQNAISGARAKNGIAAVLTFWPHPSWLFRPEQPVPQILSPEGKARVLRSLGVDLVIEEPFNRQFASIPADHFVQHLRRHLPNVRALYIGQNWRFGQGRLGDAAHLAELGKTVGVDVIAEPRLEIDGSPISSTRIRACIKEGDFSAANRLLGYPYFSHGTVREGKKLGRTIGFPTLNLPWPQPLLQPKFGVYAVRVRRADAGETGEILPGIANFGIRPTVAPDEAEPLLEVFLLGDSCPWSAGDSLQVEWLEFVRPEKRFKDLDELKRQISRDVEHARKLHLGPAD